MSGYSRARKDHVGNDRSHSDTGRSSMSHMRRPNLRSRHPKICDTSWREKLRERQLLSRSKWSYRPKGDGGDFPIERPVHSDQRSFADFESKINILREQSFACAHRRGGQATSRGTVLVRRMPR